MRASDLLGRQVLGPEAQILGRVVDVRLVQDGPVLGAFAALRIQGFVVGRHRTASRLGYDRHEQHGPWLVRRALRWWTRDNRFLPWEQASLQDDVVLAQTADLQGVPQL
jgi:hypothetical protein